MAAYQLRTGNEVLPGTYNKDNELPFKVEYDGDVKCSKEKIYADGRIFLSGCKVNGGDKEYSYGYSPCVLEDKDNNGVASLSDVVTCGTESFYVMKNENNETTMLAKYNLNIGTNTYNDGTIGLQNEFAKGRVDNNPTFGEIAFSDTYYFQETETTEIAFVYNDKSNLYTYVEEYETYLNEELEVGSASASLMSYDQAVDLGCADTVASGIDCSGAPIWFSSTSYWLGSVYDHSFPSKNYGNYAVFINNQRLSATNSYNMNGYLGVRPVITVSTSDIG